jgi:hypothetical protein
MLNQDVQSFICSLTNDDGSSERSFNRAWDELQAAIYELTNRPDDMPEEYIELIDKFIRVPAVVNVLMDLATGKCCPPDSTDESREKAWKFYDYVPPKTCKEIVYDWKVYLNNINGGDNA